MPDANLESVDIYFTVSADLQNLCPNKNLEQAVSYSLVGDLSAHVRLRSEHSYPGS
jgi:hypothetical protein